MTRKKPIETTNENGDSKVETEEGIAEDAEEPEVEYEVSANVLR